MGVIGIPVIDRHPVEVGPEIRLHPALESPDEGLWIAALRGNFERDDETKAMSITLPSVMKLDRVNVVG